MGYLYGDSTPFPLNENFIETLRGATDICFSLLQADEAMEQMRNQTEQEKRSAERDLAGVERLATALNEAMAPHQFDRESPFTTEMFTRLMSSARGVFESGSRDVVSRRDSALMQMESRLIAERSKVPQALERFLLRHDLPDTQWSFNWLVRGGGTQNTEQAQAWAVARTPAALEATFEIDMTDAGLWARPFRVAEVRPDIVLQLPRKGRWNKDHTLKEERLDRYVVTEVTLTPTRWAMVVRKGAKSDSSGLEFVIGHTDAAGVTVKSLDDPSGPEDAILMEGVDAATIASLWESLAVRLRPLATRRVRLVQALLDGAPVTEVESPAKAAKLIIDAISPYVREMSRRSAVAGELVLKREVEDGRREELFISVRELTSKLGQLSPRRQAYFEDFGLVYDMVSDHTSHDGSSHNGKVSGEMVVHSDMIVADEAQQPAIGIGRYTSRTGPIQVLKSS